MRSPFLLLAGAALIGAGLPAAELAPMRDIIADDFAFAAQQYDGLINRVAGRKGLPRSFRDGEVVMVAPEDWTSGFFAGGLWLLAEGTGDARWRAAAREWTARSERMRHFSGNHDTGFMLGCSFGQGLRLTGDPAYREVLLDGAEAAASRFDPKVGAIRSWNGTPGGYLVIVDNMMNLELLMWAAREGDRPRLREIALSHADKTLAHHFRSDGSSWHVVDYNPENGEPRRKYTHQGAEDWSAWARGQAWGLYGYTMMYREARRPEYLAQAVRIAEFLRHHPRLPEDGIPYWDFDALRYPNEPRDSSAGAIMASALLELSGFVDGEQRTAYRDLAERQLRSLSSSRYRAPLGENGNFLLMHGVGHRPQWSEVEAPLVYGDYYFLEALSRFRAQLAAAGG